MSDSGVKVCKGCGESKELSEFSICLRKGNKIYYRSNCKSCRLPKVQQSNLEQYWKDPEARRARSSAYHYSSKNDEKKAKRTIYARTYRAENPDKIRANQKRSREKRQQDPAYRLRSNISRSVREAIALQGSSKGRRSFWKYVDYTLEVLVKHIESLFDPWMTWDNYGVYSLKTWNDNDQTTWMWNLDHIKPQSELPYSSMKDENFKIAWALKNLRPYKAKQNVLDGANRTRHKGVNKNVV